ncbi:uncharacterized protein LOC143469474 isoform X1 [Clavelina lepadiformis]|uniref:uncharacterized protein LOC143469474 isoform X1 n=1 Tax=Clavelina lepadiformis TaxID=159417 RepID=UPI0040436B60
MSSPRHQLPLIVNCAFAAARLFFFLCCADLFALSAAQQEENAVFQNENVGDVTPTTIPIQPQEPQGVAHNLSPAPLNNVIYIVIIALACMIGVLGFTAAGVCWYRHTKLLVTAERVLYRSSDSSILIRNGSSFSGRNLDQSGAHTTAGLAKRTDYPAYGVTGPNPLHEQSLEPPIDVNLNKSAEVYHYNQTKKKMKAMSSESSASSRTNDPLDDAAELEIDDEETSDGEYTVYECSGFASAVDGDMEVHNPYFQEMSGKTNGKFSYPVATNFQTNAIYAAAIRGSSDK